MTWLFIIFVVLLMVLAIAQGYAEHQRRCLVAQTKSTSPEKESPMPTHATHPEHSMNDAMAWRQQDLDISDLAAHAGHLEQGPWAVLSPTEAENRELVSKPTIVRLAYQLQAMSLDFAFAGKREAVAKLGFYHFINAGAQVIPVESSRQAEEVLNHLRTTYSSAVAPIRTRLLECIRNYTNGENEEKVGDAANAGRFVTSSQCRIWCLTEDGAVDLCCKLNEAYMDATSGIRKDVLARIRALL